jgi:hypothetical protein
MINRKSAPIKVLVRHAKLNKFLSPGGGWTRKAETALNFPNLINAVHTCLLRSIHEVELILRFEGDKADSCFRIEIG